MTFVASAVDLVKAEVSELVRLRGLDPFVDRESVRELIADVIAEYHDRAVHASLPSLGDSNEVSQAVYQAIAGFGALQPYLDDPEVEEVWINEPGKVFVARRGRSELTTTILPPEDLDDLIERMLRTSGRRVDVSTPFVDAMLPDGSRLHVVIPEVTHRHKAVNIRKFVLRAHSLDELVRLGTLTAHAARFLEAAVCAGLNILVSGGTQAGKTTLLNCLCAVIPPRDRVVTCEEVFELRLALPDSVAMQTRQPNLEGAGEIPLRRLIREALRMRPDRLIIGEVRHAECLDLLIALNSGLPGMCSLHANSAREAIIKMCTLPLLAGENVGHGFVVPTVASVVDLVIHLDSEVDGRRRVQEIVAIPGRVESGIIETADIFSSRDGRLVRASGFPPHAQRFARASIDVVDLLGRPNSQPFPSPTDGSSGATRHTAVASMPLASHGHN